MNHQIPGKIIFPLWQYLNQRLNQPEIVINPFCFWHNYKIQRLEYCWNLDRIQFLEKCWEFELR
ncbi:hypothetical protein [Brunnivagina elsteri]|uniref:Uncharacterized protein n=1 Tax=Brunnivagina elsteri CCALA 953 TaxID=987040 RepID=A0A2A2TLJ1_9CYAN|nr:hypothetical protein [Calothrix elsteri]PAX58322.1 hypothetical protein CK510_08015 [Calothrix elsteri CCALA 953]